MAPVIEVDVKEPRPRWTAAEGSLPQRVAELRWHVMPDNNARPADDRLRQDRGDWWRVAAMVAAVLCGSGLALYALIEWAMGM
jgi:hypothetical protein